MTVETFNQNSTNVSILSNQLTINPSAELQFNTSYKIEISSDSFSNIYVLGYYYSNPLYINNFSSVTDGNINVTLYGTLRNNDYKYNIITKYNTHGQAQWATTIGGENSDIGTSISTDSYNNVYVAGYYSSSSIQINNFGSVIEGNINLSLYGTLANSGSSDIFIVKYNTNGHAQWATRIDGTSPGIGVSISTDSFGNVYVTGQYSSSSVQINSFDSVTSGVINITP